MYINGATEIGSLWISELQRSTMLTWFHMTSRDLRHLLTSYGKFWQISNVQSWICVKRKQSCQNSRSKGSKTSNIHWLSCATKSVTKSVTHRGFNDFFIHLFSEGKHRNELHFGRSDLAEHPATWQECSHVKIIRHHLTIQHHDACRDTILKRPGFDIHVIVSSCSSQKKLKLWELQITWSFARC